MAHLARLLVLAVLASAPALAGPAPTLRYAGTLSDAAGRPLVGTYLLRFQVYEDGGERPAWSESLYVKADQGRFAALLGRQRALPDAVLRGAYRLVVEAPPGTGWSARAEGLPTLDRPLAASAPAASRAPAEDTAARAPADAGRLERELAAAKAEAERARRENEESRRRLDALEQAVAAPARAAAPAGPRIYVVQPGDTLRTVAARTLGDERQWITVYQANQDRLQRAGELTPGQKLVIPAMSR